MTNQKINALANECLANAEIYTECDADDLANASLILMSVLTPLAFDQMNRHKLTLSQRCIVMEEIGKNIRQTVQLATGIDLHDAVNNFGWPEIVD